MDLHSKDLRFKGASVLIDIAGLANDPTITKSASPLHQRQQTFAFSDGDVRVLESQLEPGDGPV